MVKIITVVGARPQFIKAAAFCEALKKQRGPVVNHKLIHTGQHFDDKMSDVFFKELGIGSPDFNLGISGGTHASMTGRMMECVESILMKEQPDWVLLYGDTNSTIAGALAAAKLNIKVAHVEAGLRSFNNRMPEEINRIVTDRLSTLLFCPTDTASANLRSEGITQGVHIVGDVMYDVARHFATIAYNRSNVLTKLGLKGTPYVLATCHRAENTDDPERLAGILRALQEISHSHRVVMPFHPRTRLRVFSGKMEPLLAGLQIIDPISYLDMLLLESNAVAIITDSGGMQKEAFFSKVPCITTRDETEWTETVTLGWNVLTGANSVRIVEAFHNIKSRKPKSADPYGQGNAAELILESILEVSRFQ